MDNSRFGQDAAYADSIDLATKTVLNKILKDRAYEVTLNPRYDGYQRELASMVSNSNMNNSNIDKQSESKYKWSASSRITQCIQGLKITFRQ